MQSVCFASSEGTCGSLWRKTLIGKALGLIKLRFCFGLSYESKVFFPLLKPKAIFICKTAPPETEMKDLIDVISGHAFALRRLWA